MCLLRVFTVYNYELTVRFGYLRDLAYNFDAGEMQEFDTC